MGMMARRRVSTHRRHRLHCSGSWGTPRYPSRGAEARVSAFELEEDSNRPDGAGSSTDSASPALCAVPSCAEVARSTAEFLARPPCIGHRLGGRHYPSLLAAPEILATAQHPEHSEARGGDTKR